MNNIKTKLFPYYGLIVVSLFPLLNIKGVSITIIIFSFLSLVYLFSDIKKRWNPDLKSFILTSIPISLYLIGLFYTNDLKQAIKVLETALPLFMFPFLLFIILGKNFIINKTIVSKLLNNFILAGSAFILIIIFYLIYSDAWLSFFNEEMFIKTTQNKGKDIIRWTIYNTPFFGEHPTYFGLISIFVSLFSLFKVLDNKKEYFLSIVIGTTGVLISGSKMSIIALIIVGSLFFLLLLKSKMSKLISLVSFALILLIVFVSFPILKVRFAQLINTKLEVPHGLRYNSTNVRVAIFHCTLENIKKSPLIGEGTGGSRKGMEECYKQYDTDIFKKNNYYYNSHNQYLSFVLSNGIIGLIAFIFWLYIFFHSALINNDKLFLLSILVFILMFLTENLLERQTGSVMFSFLIPLLYKNKYSLNG